MMDGAPRGLLTCCAMLVKQSLSISDIRVPAKRGKTLDAAKRDLLFQPGPEERHRDGVDERRAPHFVGPPHVEQRRASAAVVRR